MKKEDIIERHWKLWEEQNKQIRRTVAASLVFAVIALFNIIIPFKNLYIKKAHVAEQIKTVQSKLNDSEAALENLKILDDVMADVSKTLDRRPWDAQRYNLIDSYRRLSNRERGTTELYQSMADSTVRSIAAEVRASVYEPLAPFLNQQSEISSSAPQTFEQAKMLVETLDEWEQENIGKTWYRTLASKEATINNLSESLYESLFRLARTLENERQQVNITKNNLDQEIRELQSINLSDQEKEIKELEDRMMKILPSWIRGLVSIEQLALYFPHIIAGILIFVLWLGHALSLHFSAATQNIQDKELVAEPALSSNWTLTRRSSWGTVQSYGTYLLYSAAMFFAFEKGLGVMRESNIAEPLRAATFVFSPLFFWLLRGVMIATVLYVLGRRFMARQRA